MCGELHLKEVKWNAPNSIMNPNNVHSQCLLKLQLRFGSRMLMDMKKCTLHKLPKLSMGLWTKEKESTIQGPIYILHSDLRGHIFLSAERIALAVASSIHQLLSCVDYIDLWNVVHRGIIDLWRKGSVVQQIPFKQNRKPFVHQSSWGSSRMSYNDNTEMEHDLPFHICEDDVSVTMGWPRGEGFTIQVPSKSSTSLIILWWMGTRVWCVLQKVYWYNI